MKKTENIPLFRRADIICVVAVLLFSVLLILVLPKFFYSSAEVLRIDCEGEASYYTLENQIIFKNSGGYEMIIAVENSQVFVRSCECPEKICVASKPISKGGESIVCVPSKVKISLVGEAPYDAVTK